MAWLIVIPMVLGPVVLAAGGLYILFVLLPGDERRRLRTIHLERAQVYIDEGRKDLARREIEEAEKLF